MTPAEIILKIAKLVYNHGDCKATLADELKLDRAALDKLLDAEVLPRNERLMLIGFASKKAELLNQRAHKLNELVNKLSQ